MTDQHVDSTAVNDYIEMLSTEIKYQKGIIAGLQDALALAEDYLRRP